MPLASNAVMQSVRSFFTDELWSSSVPGKRASVRDWGRFVTIVVHGFNHNRCPIRAAALCYNTLLALVPLMVVILGVSKAMLATREDKLFDYCMEAIGKVAPQIDQATEEQQQEMRKTLSDALGAVNAGALGLVGSAMLIVTSVSLFSTIERALNDIWGVQRGRSPMMKVVFYWTALTLGSILIFVAIGITGTLKVPAVVGFLEQHGVLNFLGGLLPLFVLWIGFFLLYLLMPNTKVELRAAILGGVVAGTLWQLNNWANVIYVSKVVSSNKLYGSLGLVPIFMLGLYISWIFVLLGAQVAYTLQNARVLAREKEDEIESPNQHSKELIAMRIMLVIARQFVRAEPPISTTEVSNRIGAPLHLINRTVQRLCDARLLVEIAGNQAMFEPARPVEQITVHDVLRAMRELDGKPQETTRDEDDALIRSIVEKVDASVQGPARSFDFRKLVDESKTRKT
ncbi:MAG: YihY family inner membrane protein [Verrucomicrobiae bacterium]|nr:YihY family inner membrane protein [Verrucomicrobiae bacterium]